MAMDNPTSPPGGKKDARDDTSCRDAQKQHNGRPLSTYAAWASAFFALTSLPISVVSCSNSSEQARTAREALRIVQRAYLATSINAVPYEPTNAENKSTILNGYVQNVGNTPAYKFNLIMADGVVEQGQQDSLWNKPNKFQVINETIEPKDKYSLLPVNFSKEERQEVLNTTANKRLSYYYMYKMSFMDAFGDTHSQIYCLEGEAIAKQGMWHPPSVDLLMHQCQMSRSKSAE